MCDVYISTRNGQIKLVIVKLISQVVVRKLFFHYNQEFKVFEIYFERYFELSILQTLFKWLANSIVKLSVTKHHIGTIFFYCVGWIDRFMVSNFGVNKAIIF